MTRRKMFPFPLLILPFLLLAGLVVMLLWNAIMPVAIHASAINYWQALGMFVLSKILFGFGGFRGRGGMGRGKEMWRHNAMQWREKWMNMSDEERAKFREEWRGKRCGKHEEK